MTKSIAESKEALAFRREAQRFCRCISRIGKKGVREASRDLVQLLHSLCHQALQLPDIERWPDLDHPFCFSVSERRRRRLARYFGKYDVYQGIYDPYDRNDTEVIPGRLSIDLESVYDDIWPGIRSWGGASADVRRGIVWQWKFYYELHWGHHAVDAIRGFHFLLFYHDAGGENDDVKELRLDRRGRPVHQRKRRKPR